MKKLIAVFLLTVASANIACIAAIPPTLQTPVAKKEYTADEITKRVNELENAAIQANTNGGLSEGATRLIVAFAVDADKTLAATPDGWQQTVLTAWNTLKTQLPTFLGPTVSTAVGILDPMIQSLGGTQ